jgi:hypothetical protein
MSEAADDEHRQQRQFQSIERACATGWRAGGGPNAAITLIVTLRWGCSLLTLQP